MRSAVRRLAGASAGLCGWLAGGTAQADCFDRIQNGPESDIDCGGDCVPCDIGDLCESAHDCVSGRCAGGECEERPWRKGQPIPRGYHVEVSDTDGAAISRTIGWVTLGVGYGAAYVGALTLPGELSWFYVPIVGPWVLVLDETRPKRGLIALDAAFQSVGAALLLGGLLGAGDHLVRDPPSASASGMFRVMPTAIGERGYGVGVLGTF